MVGRGIAPNATTYQCLLKGAAKEGRVELALATLQEMEQKGIPFNPTTLPIFVNILVGNNQGCPSLVPRVIVWHRTNGRVWLSDRSHTQAAKEMDKSDMLATTEVPVDRHRLSQALEMADTFDKKYNLWLDRSSLQTLLRACVQAEQWPQAKQLVARAHQRRVNVNAPLLTLINAH
jgi:pentatricopeptide repeat protein